MIQNVCPVCETYGSKLKCSVREQDYLACLTCGHTFLRTLPESGALANFYQSRESHHVRREKVDWDYSELKYRRFYRPLLERIGAVVSGRQLLDVGTGNGAFLAAAERMGWEARGLELEAGSLEIARARGLTVSDCKLNQGDFANDSIDAVTSWQVIEHVDDFSEYLGEIRRILAPGGVVALSTPNIQSIGWRLLGPRWQAVEPEVHMHLFTPHSMDRLLTRYGFSRVSLRTADIKPTTLRRTVRRRHRSGLTEQRFAEFATKAGTGRMEAMFTILALMNPIFGATGLGEDIYAVYRKST